MSITLNFEQETFAERLLWRVVANLIATGSFQTVDEVLQVALKMLETERKSYESWIVENRDRVREGIESLERGEGVDGETVVNELLAKLRHTREVGE
jgi:antitoxin ParD1/3/4